MIIMMIGESLTDPATRYRLTPLARDLRAAGHTVHQEAIEDSVQRRDLWSRAGRADLVILQRRLMNRLDLWRLSRTARRLVFDFDDALCFRDRAPFLSRTRRQRFRFLCRRASLVVAGNNYLGELASQAGASRFIVVPTCIDESPSPTPNKERSSRFRIAWIGGNSTRRYLELIRPSLARIAPRDGNVIFRVIADKAPSWPEVEIEACSWREETEWDDLAECRFGVAPLPEDPWTRGKCGLKVLQYAFAGRACVASPVGVQRAMVMHGQTGFLAGNESEWVESLKTLIESPAQTDRMGQEARAHVSTAYRWSAHSARWLETIESL